MRSAQAWPVALGGIALLISVGCRTPPKIAQILPVIPATALSSATPQVAPSPEITNATTVEPVASDSPPETDTRKSEHPDCSREPARGSPTTAAPVDAGREQARGDNSKQKSHFESRPQSLPIRIQVPGRAAPADRPAAISPQTKLSAPSPSLTRNPAPPLTIAPAGQSELSAASLPNTVPVPAPSASTPSANVTTVNPIRIGSLLEKSGDDSDWREWQLVRQRTREQVRHAEREKLLHNLTNLLQRAGQ